MNGLMFGGEGPMSRLSYFWDLVLNIMLGMGVMLSCLVLPLGKT